MGTWINAARLNRVFTVLTAVTSDDGQGGQAVTSWTAGVRIPGALEARSARDSLTGGALQPMTSETVTVRYWSGLSTTNRLRLEPDATVYDILGVRDPDGRRVQLVLDVAKVVA